MSLPFQEPFTGTGALQAGWGFNFNVGSTQPQCTANQLSIPSSVSGLANWGTDVPSADQYCQMVITTRTAGADAGFGPAVRLASGALTGYFSQAGASDTRLYLLSAGSFTPLGSVGAAITAGHTLKLQVVGTTLTLTDNGTPICGTPLTNATVASGRGGFWFGGESTDRGDDLEIGSLGGGPIIGLMTMGAG